MQVAIKILFYSVLIPSLAACSGSGGENVPAGSMVWKEQQTSVEHKLDILWVLDSTSSMSAIHTSLASSMDAVFSKMISLRLDFRMAAITMDMRPTIPHSEGRLLGDPQVLDLDTWNLQESFSKLVQPALNDLAEVRAFDALDASLSYQNLQGIHTFLREDAVLAVIFVSDKRDASTILIEQMQEVLNRYKPKFKKQSWVSHSLLTGCGLSNSPSLKQFSEFSGGIHLDTCKGISDALEKFQQRNLEIVTEISLQPSINPAQLRVTVNGVVVPNQIEDGWIYHPESHGIRFYGSAQPAADAIVKVQTAQAR
jgi:hypothetical protein